MKCPECRKAEMETRRENHRYTESGLPSVVLKNIEVRHCPACGAETVSIPRMAQLHRTIALSLIRKRARLTPVEIRYLRKSAGWSGKDFAERFHVDPATVSRWEREDKPQQMEIGYELALRLAVAHGEQISEYDVKELGNVASKEAEPERLALWVGENGWQAELPEAA